MNESASGQHEDGEVTTYGDLMERRRVYICVRCGRERVEVLTPCDDVPADLVRGDQQA